MNWYVGMNIVAIVTDPDGYYKEGDIFPIKGLTESMCKCSGNYVNIGKSPKADRVYCTDCHASIKLNGIRWHSEEDFRPLDELADISELTEVLATTKPFEVK